MQLGISDNVPRRGPLPRIASRKSTAKTADEHSWLDVSYISLDMRHLIYVNTGEVCVYTLS